jgi:hypothetical protein
MISNDPEVAVVLQKVADRLRLRGYDRPRLQDRGPARATRAGG